MLGPGMKVVASLFSGCALGVVLALNWTGADDLATAKQYAYELECIIEEHSKAGDQILADLEQQKKIYKYDVNAFKKTLEEANKQTTKANAEIKKANDAAEKHKKDLEKIVERVKEHGVVESTGTIMWNCDEKAYVPGTEKPASPDCPTIPTLPEEE